MSKRGAYRYNQHPSKLINCRCALVRIKPKPEQLDLFGSFSPATMSFDKLMKELQK